VVKEMSDKFEEKRNRLNEKKDAKIRAMPVIAMCEWENYGNDVETQGKMLYRNKVLKITKRAVMMRCLNSDTGTITLSVRSGDIRDSVTKIEMMPCDTTEWARPDDKMKVWLNAEVTGDGVGKMP
jgi:hypothetical protein